MEKLVVIVALLPLVSAVLVHLSSGRLGRRVARVSVTFAAVTFSLAAVVLATAVVHGASGQISLGHSWGIFLFDPLSSLMATVIAGISLIVHIYSVRYMAEEPGYGR
ncbi:MAG: NADH-quinone oxidoreductase subunit L, partial [Gammaproteobacteria bacterium]